MPRRNHRRRPKDHRPNAADDPSTERTPTFEQMARSLVLRGLASDRILEGRR